MPKILIKNKLTNINNPEPVSIKSLSQNHVLKLVHTANHNRNDWTKGKISNNSKKSRITIKIK